MPAYPPLYVPINCRWSVASAFALARKTASSDGAPVQRKSRTTSALQRYAPTARCVAERLAAIRGAVRASLTAIRRRCSPHASSLCKARARVRSASASFAHLDRLLVDGRRRPAARLFGHINEALKMRRLKAFVYTLANPKARLAPIARTRSASILRAKSVSSATMAPAIVASTS